MFQFPGFPWYTYVFSIPFTVLHREGFPIRIPTDILLIYSSPWLFAVNRVLHRLLMPRHSPYALCNLNLLFSFAWYSQYLLQIWLLVFTTLWWQNCSFLTFFLGKTNFSISIAFSISVRLLYSVFNDHLQLGLLHLRSFPETVFAFACEVMPEASRKQVAGVFRVAKYSNGRSGWSRTIDLAIISRVL